MRSRRSWPSPPSWLFANGFGFILPYVALYLTARALDWPTAVLRALFLALHAATIVGLAAWALPRLRRADGRMVAFWLALTALFLLPGAYLEYPSDPWEHVRRIYGWATAERLGDHGTGEKFAYFWGWTWLSGLSPGWRPLGLAVYGAFWQLLLAAQFYRLARALGFAPGWSALQVAGTVALFGTNLFAFYRYYALSSTPLAYVAYLYGLGVVLGGAASPWRRVIPLGLAALVAAANHVEEALWLALAAPAVAALDWTCRRPRWGRWLAAAAVAAVFVGALGFGTWLRARHPELYGLQQADVSALGVYRLWDVRTVFFETLGLHGVLGALAACLIARARPRVALLTLLPLILLSFPPFVLFTARTFGYGYIVYRVLYAFPASFALVAALETLTMPRALRRAVAVGLAVIALVPVWPVRGRLFFQLYVPPAANRLTHLYPLADELARHAPWSSDCTVASDPATHFFLVAHLGLRLRASRIGTDDLLTWWAGSPSPDSLPGPNGEPIPVCAAVLFGPRDVPASTGSAIARASRHWSERRSDPRAYVPADVSALRARVTEAGWTPIGVAAWINPRTAGSRVAGPGQARADPQR